MGRGARGIQLHGDSGSQNFPVTVEIDYRAVQLQALRIHGGQKSLRAVQRTLTGEIPTPREQRRDDTVPRGHSRVKWLDHASEVLFQSASRRCGDAQRMDSLSRIQTEDACGGGGRADCAYRRRAMPPTIVIVARV